VIATIAEVAIMWIKGGLEHKNGWAENPGDDFVDRTGRNPTFLEGVNLVGDFDGLESITDLLDAN
jgi:hypothetical protein